MNVADHLGFIYGCAYQMNIQDEEIIGDAILKAVQVAPRYDPEKGSERNFLFRHVKGALVRSCRKQQRHGMTGDMPKDIFFDSYPRSKRSDREDNGEVEAPVDSGINWPLIEKIMDLGALTGFEKQVVRLKLHGFFNREIAEKLDSSHQAVGCSWRNAMKKMRTPSIKELLC